MPDDDDLQPRQEAPGPSGLRPAARRAAFQRAEAGDETVDGTPAPPRARRAVRAAAVPSSGGVVPATSDDDAGDVAAAAGARDEAISTPDLKQRILALEERLKLPPEPVGDGDRSEPQRDALKAAAEEEATRRAEAEARRAALEEDRARLEAERAALALEAERERAERERAELTRLEAERRAEAEATRRAEEEARRAALEEDRARLEAERAALALQAERERAERERAELARLEAERRAEEEAMRRAEEEATRRAEEARRAALEEDRARLEAERAALEAEREALLAAQREREEKEAAEREAAAEARRAARREAARRAREAKQEAARVEAAAAAAAAPVAKKATAKKAPVKKATATAAAEPAAAAEDDATTRRVAQPAQPPVPRAQRQPAAEPEAQPEAAQPEPEPEQLPVVPALLDDADDPHAHDEPAATPAPELPAPRAGGGLGLLRVLTVLLLAAAVGMGAAAGVLAGTPTWESSAAVRLTASPGGTPVSGLEGYRDQVAGLTTEVRGLAGVPEEDVREELTATVVGDDQLRVTVAAAHADQAELLAALGAERLAVHIRRQEESVPLAADRLGVTVSSSAARADRTEPSTALAAGAGGLTAAGVLLLGLLVVLRPKKSEG